MEGEEASKPKEKAPRPPWGCCPHFPPPTGSIPNSGTSSLGPRCLVPSFFSDFGPFWGFGISSGLLRQKEEATCTQHLYKV